MNSAIGQTQKLTDFFRGSSGASNYQRLVLITAKKLMYARLTNPYVTIQDPEHYVNEAVQRCFPNSSGAVARDLDRDVPLEALLVMVIESVISHELYPSKARSSSKAEFESTSDEGEENTAAADDYSEPMWSDAIGAAQVRRSADRTDDDQVIRSFAQFVQKDDIVHRMVMLLLNEDIDEPAELVAERLGIEVSDVYVARKRFARLCQQFTKGGRN